MVKATVERNTADGGKYVVWVRYTGGQWYPRGPLSRNEADEFAEVLEARGTSFKVVPSPRTTIEDLLE